jgi:mannosyltransferase OCH1-like enzyme
MIPKVIYQTWKTKEISDDLKNIIDSWKKLNPDYDYFLYDDNDCRNYIKDNFDEKILSVYNQILPGAFKADLWRYCILYKKGGVYVDIDTICLNSINNFIKEDTHAVIPIDLNKLSMANKEGTHNLFNAFIAIVPESPIILNCINFIVKNVENKIIPKSVLDFSGPGLLGRATNTFLNLPEESSFIGKEGYNNKIHFLKFERNTEYIKDINNNILFQNKNGNTNIKKIYEKELNKTKNVNWLSSKPF